MDIFEQERAQFRALTRWTYLDHATFGLIPQYSLDVMQAALLKQNADGINIEEFWSMWNQADKFRSVLGRMIGCKGSEIVYGQSSTQLFNIFANGINLRQGDNIVTTDSVYPADAYTFLNLKSKGVTLRYAKTTPLGITPEELLSYTDEHTKAIILCMVENKTGWRHDMKRIGQLCKAKGILFAADATQCTNVFRIDVREMQIDFLTTSLYKWLLGPQGHGFGYINKDLLPQLSQSVCGWVGTTDRTRNNASELKLSADAKRFELGGINFAAQVGLEKVVNRYLALGAKNVEERVQSLVQAVYDQSGELKKFRLNAKLPKENRSAIVIFKIPQGMNVTDEMLAQRNIRARVMHGSTIRTGFHYFNNFQDTTNLITSLQDIELQF